MESPMSENNDQPEDIKINSSSRLAETIREKQRSGEIPHIVRLGDILSLTGLVTKEFIKNALKSQITEKKKIGELLIERGFVSEDQVTEALAIKFGLEFVDLADTTPTYEAVNLLAAPFVRKMQIMPVAVKNNILTIAISSPTEHATIEDILRFSLNRRIKLVVASAFQISQAIERHYKRSFISAEPEPQKAEKKSNNSGPAEVDIDSILDKMVDDANISVVEEYEDDELYEGDSLVITLVNNILMSAVARKASDIHFESQCQGKQTLVRYRIDGICHDVHAISPLYERAVISRIKIISKLDISERRRPQSGKIKLNYHGEIIEFRVEITPTSENREDAVLRILSHADALPLSALGFSEANLLKFQSIIEKPYGIILCAGPTGSGKTTTLHAALGHINTPDRKIWTAEDPIEITQKRLRQVQVKPEIGFSFPEALRSFLRADPDVIMIGEMRDLETTRTGIEASLTGHLVFSTLHTNSAAETIGRLIEMGIEPYNFADALLGILAQRLCRKLCPKCKTEKKLDKDEFDLFVKAYGPELYKEDNLPESFKELKTYRPAQCQNCNSLGYSGRIAVHELLINNEEIKKAIQKNEQTKVIYDLALKNGMRSLRVDGLQKVIKGITSFKEVIRVTG
jgi:type II secretory ATPase GspE/PulE/Tfp pilus assembly ATPase PilB-like protein